MNRIFILIFALFGVISPALSQTMEEAIAYAQMNSSEAQIILKNQYRGKMNYFLYLADRKPSLTFQSIPVEYYSDIVQRYSYTDNKVVYRTQRYGYSTANLRLQQNVDFLGGYAYVDTDLKYYQTFGESSFPQFTSIPFRIGYTQNLLGYNGLKWQRRIEPLKYEVVSKTALADMESVAIQTIDLFFSVALLRKQCEQAKAELATCDTLCMTGQENYKLERITLLSLQELQIERARMQNTYREKCNELEVAEMRYRAFLNMNENERIGVDVSFDVPHIDISYPKALFFAKENSVDLLTARQQEIQCMQNVDLTYTQKIADVSFNASIGFNQISDNILGAYRKPLREQMFSLSVQVPICDNGKKKMNHSLARANLDAMRITAEEISQDIEINLKACISKHTLLQEIMQSSADNYQCSLEIYQETIDYYNSGKKRIEDVSRAIAKKEEALICYYDNLKSFWINYYNIRKMTLYDFIEDHELEFSESKSFIP